MEHSGNSGFMLGEILGLSAGLTRAELVLFRFLLIRDPLASFFLLLFSAKPGLVGDVSALSMGLGFPESAAPADGVLIGPSLGVFRAGMRGVLWSSSCRIAVSIRERDGLEDDEAASGRERSSSISCASGGLPKSGDCWRRMREAGVAGHTPWEDMFGDADMWLPLAEMAGECVTEPGRGGGRISAKGSGDMDSASELSRLCGSGRALELDWVAFDCCASSKRSLTSFG